MWVSGISTKNRTFQGSDGAQGEAFPGIRGVEQFTGGACDCRLRWPSLLADEQALRRGIYTEPVGRNRRRKPEGPCLCHSLFCF